MQREMEELFLVNAKQLGARIITGRKSFRWKR